MDIVISSVVLLGMLIVVIFIYCAMKINGDDRMENDKRIYEMSLIELILLMNETKDQELINRIALEITYRQYVPFKDETFEELLVKNGYKIIDKGKTK